MTEWLTAEQALKDVGIPVTDEKIKLLRCLGHKKKIRWTKMLGERLYDRESIKLYLEQKSRGGICAENRDSESLETNKVSSNHLITTSSISTEAEVAASLRGIELAQRTKRQGLRSRSSSLNGSARKLESLVSL